MRALVFVPLLVFGLSACADPVADAEKELAMVERANGSKMEICEAKRKVADANLKAHREQEYSMTKLYADVACADAKFPY
jgi:hypothetical protein